MAEPFMLKTFLSLGTQQLANCFAVSLFLEIKFLQVPIINFSQAVHYAVKNVINTAISQNITADRTSRLNVWPQK